MTVEIEVAETTIPDLLDSIERGDRINLKKDGKTVATVTPAAFASQSSRRTPEQIAATLAAFDEMQKLSRELNLDPFDFEEFKHDRDFGRP